MSFFFAYFFIWCRSIIPFRPKGVQSFRSRSLGGRQTTRPQCHNARRARSLLRSKPSEQPTHSVGKTRVRVRTRVGLGATF